MGKKPSDLSKSFIGRHPVLANILIILIIGFLGLWILYLCTAIFTKHGEKDVVPKVENVSYTEAIKILHDNGFRVDIRDSLYKEDVRPGYVIEQFPKAGSEVKPGRKIFLYINAVHPKEVMIDDDRTTNDPALRGVSERDARIRLQELGFKNVVVKYLMEPSKTVRQMKVNGHVIRKLEKVPVNQTIILEVGNGAMESVMDSLLMQEQMRYYNESRDYSSEDEGGYMEENPSSSSSYEEEEGEVGSGVFN